MQNKIQFEYNTFSNSYTFYEPNLLYKDYLDPIKFKYGTFVLSFLSIDFKQLQQDLYTFDLLFPLTAPQLITFIFKMFSNDPTINAYYSQIEKIWHLNCTNKYLASLMHLELCIELFKFQKEPLNISQVFEPIMSKYMRLQTKLQNFFSNPKSNYLDFNDFDSPSSELIVRFTCTNEYPGIKTQCYASNALSIINFDLLNISNSGTLIKKCNNCGKFFIPEKRSDEIYCDRIFKNGKTCKELGYSLKVADDPFKAAFTKTRKTHHARIRYNKHIKDYKEKHYEPWLQAATQARDKYKADNDIEGFKNWLEQHNNSF